MQILLMLWPILYISHKQVSGLIGLSKLIFDDDESCYIHMETYVVDHG